ncbi:PepSY-associated TM helix domain-containing protein [Corallococcus carmarthensis]|uniref:PepSY domain-containing protein n=1 Tax=Corallococcus carmarthensis TaxID=2316728 RepID=A0A3A8KC47_9BACT|nr:PepSY-associated TM helix domain-containing protein [Corallococcus carmarthensis]RKH01905.1 PepSY domain-containing protein [Corallococcus carmarthensis]
MKLSPRTFRIQFDLHAWAGVAASLFLFVIFFCGVFAMFREELEVWQEPALHVAPPSESPPSFDVMLERVREQGPLPRGAHVGLLTHEETRFITAYLFEPTGMRVVWLDPLTGTTLPERSRLASELYWMHFFYRVPWGMEFTGVVSVALLVALVSGLWIHLKDLRAQWWRFRPTAKPRFSASDAHKVLGVFGLPFTAMLAWTGAVLCLAGLAAQGFGSAVYRGQADRVTRLRGYSVPVREASGKDAPMLSLDAVVDRARASVPGAEGTPRYVELHDYGDARGWAGVYFQLSPLGPDHFAHVDSVSGETFGSSVESRTPNFSFERLLFDLHAGRFAEALMKPLYALLALAMCAVIVTGNLIWLERRDPLRTRQGNRVLERLTVGVSAGLAFGTAVYCAANRVLPWALARRGDWEFGLFLGAWALAVVIALVPSGSSRRVGSVLCAAAAVLFGAVVVGDVVTQDANLFTALARGLPPVFLAEALLCAMSLGCGGLAWGLRRRKATEPVAGGDAPEGPLVKA